MRTVRLLSSAVPLLFAIAVGCGGSDDGDDSAAGGEAGSAEAGANGSGNSDSGGSESGGSESGGSESGGSDSGGSAGLAGASGNGNASGTGGGGVSGSAGSAAATGGGTSGSAGSGGAEPGGSAGVAGSSGAPPALCGQYNEPCANDEDCCSEYCNPDTDLCDTRLIECLPADAACHSSIDCCNLSCVAGFCSDQQCISDNQECSEDGRCCSGTCTDGACEPLNLSCLTGGNECSDHDQCCSGLCLDGVCELGASFCVQSGDLCTRDTDCCSATCNVGDNGLGICGEVPSGSTRCTGVEGMLCQDCNDCCSRLCVPYGPYGVFVCQPAQGCRILGDLCREDRDCCGGDPDSPLLGAGNVECQKEDPNQPLGVCRNPRSCNPQGNVCHYNDDDYPCSSSSAPNDCCGDPGGGEGFCRLDPLGVPRCNPGEDQCVVTGDICSNSMDCCDEVPCVPWDDGLLHCGVPDNPDECVPLDGPCTVDADCCPPWMCIRPVGSTVGYCGQPPNVPPPTGGAGGQGGQPSTGGQAGQPSTGGQAGAPPQDTCALYGQICSENGDCCNNVPCTDGMCKFPIG